MTRKTTDEIDLAGNVSPYDDWLARHRERFEARFRRPMPWYDIVGEDELSDLAWDFSQGGRMRIGRTNDILEVLRAAHAHAKRVDTGPIGLGLTSIGLLEDELVILLPDSAVQAAVRMLGRDLEAFWEVIDHGDDYWFIAIESRWMLWQHHEHFLNPGSRPLFRLGPPRQ